MSNGHPPYFMPRTQITDLIIIIILTGTIILLERKLKEDGKQSRDCFSRYRQMELRHFIKYPLCNHFPYPQHIFQCLHLPTNLHIGQVRLRIVSINRPSNFGLVCVWRLSYLGCCCKSSAYYIRNLINCGISHCHAASKEIIHYDKNLQPVHSNSFASFIFTLQVYEIPHKQLFLGHSHIQ